MKKFPASKPAKSRYMKLFEEISGNKFSTRNTGKYQEITSQTDFRVAAEVMRQISLAPAVPRMPLPIVLLALLL